MIQSTKDTTDNLFIEDAEYYKVRVTYIPTGEFAIGDTSKNINQNLL